MCFKTQIKKIKKPQKDFFYEKMGTLYFGIRFTDYKIAKHD